MAMFERVVVVDWSASSKPTTGADSIWIACRDGDGDHLENVSTRAEAAERLHALVADDVTTLVGVDFALGYPAGTASALGLEGDPWRAMWELLASEIVDDERNRNNRFEIAGRLNRRIGQLAGGPFWGAPAGSSYDGLAATKSAFVAVMEWRLQEAVLRDAGRRPFSLWQLFGNGSVGGQSLTGIPVMESLRGSDPARVHVWPFTTGLAAPDLAVGDTVVVEVWPSLLDPPIPAGRVRDAVQVESLARVFADVDRMGQLVDWFSPRLAQTEVAAVVGEEGWVFGARRTFARS